MGKQGKKKVEERGKKKKKGSKLLLLPGRTEAGRASEERQRRAGAAAERRRRRGPVPEPRTAGCGRRGCDRGAAAPRGPPAAIFISRFPFPRAGWGREERAGERVRAPSAPRCSPAAAAAGGCEPRAAEPRISYLCGPGGRCRDLPETSPCEGADPGPALHPASLNGRFVLERTHPLPPPPPPPGAEDYLGNRWRCRRPWRTPGNAGRPCAPRTRPRGVAHTPPPPRPAREPTPRTPPPRGRHRGRVPSAAGPGQRAPRCRRSRLRVGAGARRGPRAKGCPQGEPPGGSPRRPAEQRSRAPLPAPSAERKRGDAAPRVSPAATPRRLRGARGGELGGAAGAAPVPRRSRGGRARVSFHAAALGQRPAGPAATHARRRCPPLGGALPAARGGSGLAGARGGWGSPHTGAGRGSPPHQGRAGDSPHTGLRQRMPPTPGSGRESPPHRGRAGVLTHTGLGQGSSRTAGSGDPCAARGRCRPVMLQAGGAGLPGGWGGAVAAVLGTVAGEAGSRLWL